MAVIARDFFFLMANVSFLFNIKQYTFIVENSGNVIAQKRLLQTRLLGVSVSGRALPRLSFGGRLVGQEGGLALSTLASQIQKLMVEPPPARAVTDVRPDILLTSYCERRCNKHPSGHVFARFTAVSSGSRFRGELLE